MTISSTLRFSAWKIGALFRVTGEDAATFLQGQFTNNLRGMAAGEAVYGLWLNQKGKVLADSFVVAGAAGGEFFVISYFCAAAGLKQRLDDFIIADDVIVEDLTPEWTGVSLVGAGAKAWLAETGRRGVGIIFPGRRVTTENWEWIFPTAEEANVRAQLAGWEEIDAQELERQRIKEGIPSVPTDIGPRDLPGEGGLEAEAISYTKGCYLGQEVMARLKSMGQVRRRLRSVGGPGGVPMTPAALWQEGRQVGELRSAAVSGEGFTGLAMLSLVNLRPEQGMALEVAGPAEITLTAKAP